MHTHAWAARKARRAGGREEEEGETARGREEERGDEKGEEKGREGSRAKIVRIHRKRI